MPLIVFRGNEGTGDSGNSVGQALLYSLILFDRISTDVPLL
jgi:hypothetical protein